MVCTTRKWKQYIGNIARMLRLKKIPRVHYNVMGEINMQIQLSEHFTFKKLLRFVLPSIVMMIFTSIYSVVDGLFVSNFAGKTALAAINLIVPLLMGLSALGFMIGTGGSAIVAKNTW